MTFLTTCIFCGGAVVEWDAETAKCTGYCKRPQKRLEDLTPDERHRYFKRIQKIIAIDTASNVEVRGGVL